MTHQEITELLDEVKPLIVVPKGQIDNEHEAVKRFVSVYQKLTGKKVGTGSCKDCILDAFFDLKSKTEEQIKFLTMERKYKIKEGRVIWHNHKHYTKSNLTDADALEMVKAKPGHARSFENGDELLADAKKESKPKAKAKTEEELVAIKGIGKKSAQAILSA